MSLKGNGGSGGGILPQGNRHFSTTDLQPLAEPRGQSTGVSQEGLHQSKPLRDLSRVLEYRTDPEGHREMILFPNTNWMHLTCTIQEILQSATLIDYFPEASFGSLLSFLNLPAPQRVAWLGCLSWVNTLFP